MSDDKLRLRDGLEHDIATTAPLHFRIVVLMSFPMNFVGIMSTLVGVGNVHYSRYGRNVSRCEPYS